MKHFFTNRIRIVLVTAVLLAVVLTVVICVVLYNIKPLRKYILGEDIH